MYFYFYMHAIIHITMSILIMDNVYVSYDFSYLTNIFYSMGPSYWVRIAEKIEKEYFNYDGFVVIMGTDTMAYASSAMSFMIENLGKTVVFTGSQIPFCEVYNDARRNLIVSMIFAVSSFHIPEVCLCFNDRLQCCLPSTICQIFNPFLLLTRLYKI